MNSLESRLNRHLSSDKKMHWHVDYLLKSDNAKIVKIIYNVSAKKVECGLSKYLEAQTSYLNDFGCSDCDCNSHLYYFKNRNDAIESIKDAYDSIAMDYEFFKI